MFEKKGTFWYSSRVRISGGSPRASECAARAVSTETESSITRCCRSLSLCSAAVCAFLSFIFIYTRGTHNGDDDDDGGGDTFINKYTHTQEKGRGRTNKQTERERKKRTEAMVVWIETFPLALLRVIKELCAACQHWLMPTLADVVVPLNKIKKGPPAASRELAEHQN